MKKYDTNKSYLGGRELFLNILQMISSSDLFQFDPEGGSLSRFRA